MKLSGSHYWFLPFNLGAIALSICVLSGCRTSPESRYYLYAANGTNLTHTMGINCTLCDFSTVPDTYLFGLSGVCRSTNRTIDCQPKFLHSFNVSAATFADISPSNTSESEASSAALEQFTSTTSINHSLVRRLADAVGALLILSVILCFLFIPLSLFLGSGFSGILLIFLIFDACSLFSALCIFYSIFRNEIAGAYAATPTLDSNSWPVHFGLGAWLLVGAFGCRLLSNPILFIGFVALLLSIILIPIALLLACCGGGAAIKIVYAPVYIFFVD
ncbi:hypothetical protein B0O99DRAFT_72994 [Bisporella sp. PMI_857]|nr:hypothetical protein B0O99DRAFT_72994 [Bisporella sp. PMI_857]